MNLTLNGFRTSASNLLVQELPLQTFDGALLLIDSYLAEVGGWIPDDPNDPTGSGVPNGSATPAVAVSQIVDSQTSRVYLLKGKMNVEVDLNFVANLSPDQSAEDVVAQMQPLVEAFVRRQLDKSPLAFSDISGLSGDVAVGGQQTPAQRVEIASNIDNGQTLRDPRIVALRAARSAYSLQGDWNVERIYTESDKSIVVIIREFANTEFTTLETQSSRQYVISVSPEDYSVTGGVISSVNP